MLVQYIEYRERFKVDIFHTLLGTVLGTFFSSSPGDVVPSPISFRLWRKTWGFHGFVHRRWWPWISSPGRAQLAWSLPAKLWSLLQPGWRRSSDWQCPCIPSPWWVYIPQARVWTSGYPEEYSSWREWGTCHPTGRRMLHSLRIALHAWFWMLDSQFALRRSSGRHGQDDSRLVGEERRSHSPLERREFSHVGSIKMPGNTWVPPAFLAFPGYLSVYWRTRRHSRARTR